MTNYKQLFDTIADTSSRNAKYDILNSYKQDTVIQKILYLALDPLIQFYIKKIPDFTQQAEKYSLYEALEKLSSLQYRIVTGNDAINFLADILSHLSKDNADIICRIIQKDLRCGISTATVNSVWPNLLYENDVCLAYKDISGIKFPAYSQTKFDGARLHLAVSGGGISAVSRNGRVLDLKGVFNFITGYIGSGEILDGELVFADDSGELFDRKTSNGLFNKAIKGTLTEKEARGAVFIAWDIVDRSGTIPYVTRLSNLNNIFANSKNSALRVVTTSIVHNTEEAMRDYEEAIAKGEEGIILKNIDFLWEPKRIKGVGKVKAVEEADLQIISIVEGTGKNKNKLGALVCTSSCKNLLVNVGTGFSDEERERFWSSDVIGKIVTVQYNQLIDDKQNEGRKSLFLPRFSCIRNDKDTANSLSELK
jgi:ATP-dependent DNA ligase